MNEKYSIRDKYSEVGVEEYYIQNSDSYRNPHEEIVREIVNEANRRGLIGNSVMDLCCGSGEISLLMEEKLVIGVDPYTSQAYSARTGKDCLEYSFKDIAEGKLKVSCETIICSFALHLCPVSLLHSVLWNLKDCAKNLIIISPNKKPDCHGVSGWAKKDYFQINRVKLTYYENEIEL